jgi:hypothetical protein
MPEQYNVQIRILENSKGTDQVLISTRILTVYRQSFRKQLAVVWNILFINHAVMHGGIHACT